MHFVAYPYRQVYRGTYRWLTFRIKVFSQATSLDQFTARLTALLVTFYAIFMTLIVAIVILARILDEVGMFPQGWV